MNDVQPFISPADVDMPGTFCLAICICITIRYTYRYLVFRAIDRYGYSSPQLQASHLRRLAGERGKIITSTRKQGLIALASLTGFLCLAIYVVPTWSF
ncbi:hypothetical protein A7D21_33680 [Pseudomonas sp. AP19]|nr:hypothetical protein A7D21_33680 [Pseudomonas sp. AP19]